MASPARHVLTLEQIADRWRVELAYVEQLVSAHELSRAFLVTGPSRLHLREESGRPVQYPLPGAEGIYARLLISSAPLAPGQRSWPLSQVRRIYQFLGGDKLGRRSLVEYCAVERDKSLGWSVEFELEQTQIQGQDAIWVELGDLLQYEAAHGIQVASKEQQAETARLRDRRKQRCRVAASIAWRTDPSLTLVQVYRHPWVQEDACEGRPPTEKTFREWVKDLNPNRSPGRRPRR